MHGANFHAACRRWPTRYSVLFAASFSATWFWVNIDDPSPAAASSTVRHARPALANTPAPPTMNPAEHLEPPMQQREPAADSTVPPLLPASHLAALIDAGIAAEDSEQRSQAILELSQAPVEQSLGGLGRILRENRDRRSRLTALVALMHLPDSPRVREQRLQLLELLSRDPDAAIAEAALSARGS